MFRNYFKTAWRSIRKNKVYSFINIFGLTAGLTCFLLIALYIFDELTFDRFHTNANDIFRVVEKRISPEGKELKVVSIPYNVSAQGRKQFPEIMEATRFSIFGRTNVYAGDQQQAFYEPFNLADSSFLSVLDFPLLAGDSRTALAKPYTVVISDETAIRFFGTTEVLGKTIRADRDSVPYFITAVLHIPSNSHLQFNLMFSESSVHSQRFLDFTSRDWSSNNFVTYFRLKPGMNAKGLAAKIDKLVAANRTGDQAPKSAFSLQPLKDIHFYSAGLEGNVGRQGNMMHMYVFGIVALFVLLIACINYMNLTTARFSGRSKEIAIRKVAGAVQQNLVKQFLAEAFLVTIIAFAFALVAVKLLLPAYNAFTEKQLSLGTNTDYRIWIGLALSVIIVGLSSGLYPAFFQSRLKPYLLLKSKIHIPKSNLSLRRVLVIVQFSLSIIMIVATLIVYQQLKYVSGKDMGFNKEQLLVVDINSGNVRRSAETIKAEYSKLPGIKSVSVSSRVPGEWKVLPKVKVKKPENSQSDGLDMFYIAADAQFLNTFQIQLLDGRNFSGNNAGDSTALLINETAAKLLGITTASEQQIEIPSVAFSGNIDLLDQPFKARVVGIVKDFNFQSLRDKVGPMIVAYQQNPIHNIDYFTARIETAGAKQLLEQMETVLHKIDAGHLFEFNFLDKQWELFYREDEKRQIIFLGVALMTILIACLGLFGLATYAAEQRIKEIGVRKVLGASVGNLVALLSKDFLKLVAVAALIAFPIAWWAMHNWLQDFAYRINISAGVFVLAGLLALSIALLTVSFQAIKAAMSNPVKSLRSE